MIMTEQAKRIRAIRDLLFLAYMPTFGSFGGASTVPINRTNNNSKDRILRYLNECLDMETERDKRKYRLYRVINEEWEEVG